jgi:hypothetical protein
MSVYGGQGSFAQPRVWRPQGEELHAGVPIPLEPGEAAQQAHRENAVSAARAPQILMLSGKVGYYADFVVYGTLLAASVTFTLRSGRSDQLIWIAAAVAGLAGWTLVEYLLHRGLALVRDRASCHPSSPAAPTGSRAEGGVASTPAPSLALIWREISV